LFRSTINVDSGLVEADLVSSPVNSRLINIFRSFGGDAPSDTVFGYHTWSEYEGAMFRFHPETGDITQVGTVPSGEACYTNAVGIGNNLYYFGMPRTPSAIDTALIKVGKMDMNSGVYTALATVRTIDIGGRLSNHCQPVFDGVDTLYLVGRPLEYMSPSKIRIWTYTISTNTLKNLGDFGSLDDGVQQLQYTPVLYRDGKLYCMTTTIWGGSSNQSSQFPIVFDIATQQVTQIKNIGYTSSGLAWATRGDILVSFSYIGSNSNEATIQYTIN
jgi:hypothetical protein